MSDAKTYHYPMTLFDPESAHVVLEPLEAGNGHWVGAPCVLYLPEEGAFYLYYRRRRPRGQEPDRGFACYVARSEDGRHFADVWSAPKHAFGNSPSVEKSSFVRDADGRFLLFVSFVDSADNRWRIDLLEADTPAQFDPASRRPVFTAGDIHAEGVKDPYVFNVGGLWHMIASYAPPPAVVDASSREAMHATADVYNTGIAKSSTGLAVSGDGRNWEWQGDIFAPRDRGWDSYCSRISSLVRIGQQWIAFYDGSADVSENYEEQCGLALSADLCTFTRLSINGPVVQSAGGSRSVRYVDVVPVEDDLYFYYECARADGAHDLRLSILPRNEFCPTV
ncbi:MAG: hypothetical protein F4X83_02995 [Chloroflexi bacterium]|nr:hypothetical protein [Chloroflexota bacterium]